MIGRYTLFLGLTAAVLDTADVVSSEAAEHVDMTEGSYCLLPLARPEALKTVRKEFLD